MAYPREQKPETPERTWTPAGFVLTVVAATIFGALLAEWLLSIPTVGHPIKSGVHAFEDWLADIDLVFVGIGSIMFFLIWFAFSSRGR